MTTTTGDLIETPNGEDAALARYGNALDTPLPAQLRRIVERRFDGVKRNHPRIRALRDEARAAS